VTTFLSCFTQTVGCPQLAFKKGCNYGDTIASDTSGNVKSHSQCWSKCVSWQLGKFPTGDCCQFVIRWGVRKCFFQSSGNLAGRRNDYGAKFPLGCAVVSTHSHRPHSHHPHHPHRPHTHHPHHPHHSGHVSLKKLLFTKTQPTPFSIVLTAAPARPCSLQIAPQGPEACHRHVDTPPCTHGRRGQEAP